MSDSSDTSLSESEPVHPDHQTADDTSIELLDSVNNTDLNEPDITPVDQLGIFHGIFHPLPLVFLTVLCFSAGVFVQNTVLGQQTIFLDDVARVSVVLFFLSWIFVRYSD